ncbi:persephin [Hoplias malabaricus]|uniref:persephin n=1 Tax=Hoplias malabaricus TaxID=27720 RepID=UPI0034618F61
MLFFCVQLGEGHWLQTLLALRDQGTQHPVELREGSGEEQGHQEGVVRSRRSADAPCGLRSILLQVRDLGLGYDSDEMVLFKYCVGACPRLPSNHDLTLANLQQSGTLPHTNTVGYQTTCCRPTRHEDMAFLDNAHRWHKVEKLSASACSCMG